VSAFSKKESRRVDTGTRKYNQGSPHPIGNNTVFDVRGIYAYLLCSLGSGAWRGGLHGFSPAQCRVRWEKLLHFFRSPILDMGGASVLHTMSHVMGGIQWALAANTTRALNSGGSVGNGGSTSTTTAMGPSASRGISATPSLTLTST